MNATNRALNRVILFVVGAVLAAAGSAAAMAVVWQAGGQIWSDTLTAAQEWMRSAHHSTGIVEGSTVSWFTVGLLAVLLVMVVTAVVVVSRLGGGRSSTVIREEPGEGPQGAVTIRPAFASDAIAHSLASREEILSSRVSAAHVSGSDVLHVSLTPRQNTSPVDVARRVADLVDNLAILTGRETPTLVSVHAGIRSRLAADRSRLDRPEVRYGIGSKEQ